MSAGARLWHFVSPTLTLRAGWLPALSRLQLTALTCIAALVPLGVFLQQIRAGDYQPGASFPPRVAAVIKASRTGVRGGPFASVREGAGFTLAQGLLNDVGMAAVADLWGRVSRRPITQTQLALFNAAAMALALFALVVVVSPPVRPALILLFLAVPLVVAEYRSPDSVTLHGPFAALAVVLAVAPHRRWPAWIGVPMGVLLFAMHKIRSPYGLFALAALVVVAALVGARTREYRWLRIVALVALTFVVLSVPWEIALDRRAQDPRVTDREVLRFHGIYNSLISGVGWTENRWGVKPWDPKIVEFLSKRTGLPPVGLQTLEGERRSREVYLSLWGEAPGSLVSLYVRRVPAAIRDHVWLGLLGAMAWILSAGWAFRKAWRARCPSELALLVAPIVVALGLLAQIVLIDPRLLYSYPLRFVSALGLVTAVAIAIVSRAESENENEAVGANA